MYVLFLKEDCRINNEAAAIKNSATLNNLLNLESLKKRKRPVKMLTVMVIKKTI